MTPCAFFRYSQYQCPIQKGEIPITWHVIGKKTSFDAAADQFVSMTKSHCKSWVWSLIDLTRTFQVHLSSLKKPLEADTAEARANRQPRHLVLISVTEIKIEVL